MAHSSRSSQYPLLPVLLPVLLGLLLPPLVLAQGFDLADALDDGAIQPLTPSPKPAVPAAPAGGAGGELDLEDFFKDVSTTKAPPKVVPNVPAATKAPTKPKPKPQPGFSDSDLASVGKDETYKPDKGKGGRPSGDSDQNGQYEDNSGTTSEVGTIAGIASAVVMALVGAVSSYISYQKKKLCFGIQQSLNADMVKSENPEAVVATEPQVQQTLLEPANAEPPTEENPV